MAPFSSTTPSRPVRRHRVFPVAILIGILLVAFLAVIFVFVPFRSINQSQTYAAYMVPDVNTVCLNFEADVADVTIIPTDLPNQLVRLEMNATGFMGFFGSETNPVDVTFTNSTSGNTLTVTSRVTRTEAWPLSFNLKVTCNLYVDRSAVLNITAKTSVGSMILDTEAQGDPLVFQNLTLRSTTGSARANLNRAVELRNDVSVSTTTGSVMFIWNGTTCSRNLAATLASTTGSIVANVIRSGVMGGNVTVDATTTTGSVNWGMNLSGNVGARFTSQVTTGSISLDVHNFNGDKSPIASSNYPAKANFIINSQTTTGSIHITAAYNNSPGSSNLEQTRADSIIFLSVNHSK
jgi:hypothetical protein